MFFSHWLQQILKLLLNNLGVTNVAKYSFQLSIKNSESLKRRCIWIQKVGIFIFY